MREKSFSRIFFPACARVTRNLFHVNLPLRPLAWCNATRRTQPTRHDLWEMVIFSTSRSVCLRPDKQMRDLQSAAKILILSVECKSRISRATTPDFSRSSKKPGACCVRIIFVNCVLVVFHWIKQDVNFGAGCSCATVFTLQYRHTADTSVIWQRTLIEIDIHWKMQSVLHWSVPAGPKAVLILSYSHISYLDQPHFKRCILLCCWLFVQYDFTSLWLLACSTDGEMCPMSNCALLPTCQSDTWCVTFRRKLLKAFSRSPEQFSGRERTQLPGASCCIGFHCGFRRTFFVLFWLIHWFLVCASKESWPLHVGICWPCMRVHLCRLSYIASSA